MDTIRIELEGERIVINFRREVGEIRKVRYLRREAATALGLMMVANAAEGVINLDVTSDLSVQGINAPYEYVFWLLVDPRGGRTFIACIEGKTIREVGRQLLRLGRPNSRSARAVGGAFVRRVSHCYLEDAEIDS